MEHPTIKVGIVDDDLLLVQLLKNYINSTNGYEVVLTSTGGHHFLNETDTRLPDILLLDLRMTHGDGLEVLSALAATPEAPRIIVLSSFYRRSFIGQMLKMGAHAFLPKETGLEELVKVMYAVYHNGHYFSEEQVEVMRSQLSNKLPEFSPASKDGLTERETEVLRLVCQQLSTKEIADALYISPKTVETHKTNLMIKACVKNMAGLVIYAVQNQIVDADEIVLLDR